MDDDTAARRRSGSEKRQRRRSVAVRFTDDEAAALEGAASRAGLTTGAYLRILAFGTPGPRAARRPPVERVELARLLGQLGHVGSNVNQLARAANGGDELGAVTLQETLTDIRHATQAIMKALGRGN